MVDFGRARGPEVKADEINDLIEERHNELTTEELKELQTMQIMTFQERLSGE